MQLELGFPCSPLSTSFNTASGMDCMQYVGRHDTEQTGSFQYRKRYGLHAIVARTSGRGCDLVSIPQAVWIACNVAFPFAPRADELFQYRKRYGLHAMSPEQQRRKALQEFQYRKRYGLHAMSELGAVDIIPEPVSIPQAVWIACNTIGQFDEASVLAFQYRKRYGLHAILSPRTLENSEPRNRFSSTPSLFALFPKPRGTFLSQKAVQKGCKASNSKETFVHEENLKLMTSFRKSRTSL